MENLWSDAAARDAIASYAQQGVNEDLALRVYTTRLLGGEPRLVLHGGGNTSVKTTMRDALGAEIDVLCVKGSGWDMGAIEPAGLPAVRLAPLGDFRALDVLSDEDMVNAQRCNLLDASAPNPSVETLLHAFLPHKFIDHTHSNAVVSLTDQPDPTALCAEVYGDTMGVVPYIMPGFGLAKAAAEVYERNPNVEGLILLKHGIFTFGATAVEAYTRMIDMVTLAEQRLAKAGRKVFAVADIENTASVAQVAPILRGLVAHDGKRVVLDFRTSDHVRNYVDCADAKAISGRGTVTPDHVIRTKPAPLVTPAPLDGKLDEFLAGTRDALATYHDDYHAYFTRNNANQAMAKTELDPMPRVILVPGLGLFGLGKSIKDAAIAADLAQTNVDVIADAEGLGRFDPIIEADQFDVEYWSLEQAKLGKGSEKPLARQVAVISGGASGIGLATAKAFAAQGCEVAIFDLDGDAAQSAARAFNGLGVGCDVTNKQSLRAAFDAVCETYGGVDIVVSNAGAAWQGEIGTVDDDVLRTSFELNFFAHQAMAQNAVRVMRAQGTGGVLLFNTSKQAINPGKNFGPYGLPKAATLFLMKQYALDHGKDGIRSCAVNADRIRSGLLTDDMVAQRSSARGLSETDYMSGNLLGREVTADDVAQAFVNLALAPATTAAVITVDGGNIEASLR